MLFSIKRHVGQNPSKVSGSSLFSNSWKQELVITENGVIGELLKGFKRLKMSLPFNSIAQVNIVRGLFKADIEVVNSGGTGNLVIKAITKTEAEKAKAIIESMTKKAAAEAAAATTPDAPPRSIADELRRLADFKEQGILTDAEFQTQSRSCLANLVGWAPRGLPQRSCPRITIGGRERQLTKPKDGNKLRRNQKDGLAELAEPARTRGSCSGSWPPCNAACHEQANGLGERGHNAGDQRRAVGAAARHGQAAVSRLPLLVRRSHEQGRS